MRPAEVFACGSDLLFAERAPWSCASPPCWRHPCRCGVRHAISDGFRVGAPLIAFATGAGVVAVDGLRIPAGGRKTRKLVHRGGEIGGAVDRYPVVVPQHDELAQFQMSAR